jgi:hypothetical protein
MNGESALALAAHVVAKTNAEQNVERFMVSPFWLPCWNTPDYRRASHHGPHDDSFGI